MLTTVYVLSMLVIDGLLIRPGIEFTSMQECTQHIRKQRGFLASGAGACDKLENGRFICMSFVMSEPLWSRQTNVVSNCKE